MYIGTSSWIYHSCPSSGADEGRCSTQHYGPVRSSAPSSLVSSHTSAILTVRIFRDVSVMHNVLLYPDVLPMSDVLHYSDASIVVQIRLLSSLQHEHNEGIVNTTEVSDHGFRSHAPLCEHGWQACCCDKCRQDDSSTLAHGRRDGSCDTATQLTLAPAPVHVPVSVTEGDPAPRLEKSAPGNGRRQKG